MSFRVLVTGGAVHAHLDSVKIITNRFRGGRMAELAKLLSYTGYHVTYLTAKGNVIPDKSDNLEVAYHNGFEGYKKLVLEHSAYNDAVILGAAVANLIPYKRWENKFPSHNYEEGEIVPFAFKIAPRVINTVKPMFPKKLLVGFKLLNNVSKEELVDAAYTTLIESNANFIVANDASDLDKKLIVTKEKSVIPLLSSQLTDFLRDAIEDEYYSSKATMDIYQTNEDFKKKCDEAFEIYKSLVGHNKGSWRPHILDAYDRERKIYFGSISVRIEGGTFLTTSRGKESLEETVVVLGVNHKERKIEYDMVSYYMKPSLNTPLIDNIFKTNPSVQAVVHYHKRNDLFKRNLPYYFPGTVRDSIRGEGKSFNIDHHGTYVLLDKNLEIIK